MLHFGEVITVRPILYKVIDSHLLYSRLFIQVSALEVLGVFVVRWDVLVSEAQLEQTALI